MNADEPLKLLHLAKQMLGVDTEAAEKMLEGIAIKGQVTIIKQLTDDGKPAGNLTVDLTIQ